MFQISNKKYLAVGFQNDSGGYELRNSWFKGSSSPKDVSYIHNDSNKLYVVEGFMDFLSIEQLKSKTPAFGTDADVLVLNSLSFLKRSHSVIKEHESFLFLDNDQAGTSAKTNLHHEHIPFMDCSAFYSAHKDVNEFLVARSEQPTVRRQFRI